jgi:hypothetical protein
MIQGIEGACGLNVKSKVVQCPGELEHDAGYLLLSLSMCSYQAYARGSNRSPRFGSSSSERGYRGKRAHQRKNSAKVAT